MKTTLTHKILQRFALKLPLRIIDHDGKPYLRRYHLGTIPLLNIRVYLHHFVDSDPVGLHNHPFKWSSSILLSRSYQEERRWCKIPNQRTVRFINVLTSDSMHRVLLFSDGAGNPIPVWTLFAHSAKVMTWGTLKDKGSFTQYVEELPEHKLVNGHSNWWVNAPKGWELLDSEGNLLGEDSLLSAKV